MFKLKTVLVGFTVSLSVLMTASSYAADISEIPVFALNRVDPNVLIALDNSSSMDDERLVVGYSERKVREAFEARGRKLYFSSRIFTGTPPIDAVAPTRSPEFNATYYNPDVVYEPWVTIGNYPTQFQNADPKNAAWYPVDNIYPWTRNPLDLTDKAYFDFEVEDGWNGFVCDNKGNTINMRRIRVQVGTGSTRSPRDWMFCGNQQLEGIGDRDERRSKRFKTFRMTYDFSWAFYYKKEGNCGDESTWYPKASCLKKVEIKDAKGLQNFANWFTYYRDRLLILKGALGGALAEHQGKEFNAGMFPINIRAGRDYFSFTKNDFATHPTAYSFKDFQASNNKADYLRKIYEMPMEAGTPLRDALFTAGEIYAQTGSGRVVQHACQPNHTILFTDGYDTEQRISGIPSSIRNSNNNAADPYKGSTSFTLSDFSHYYYNNLSERLKGIFPLSQQKVTVPEACKESNPPAWLDCNEKLHMTTFTIGMGAIGHHYNPDDPNADSVEDVHRRNSNSNTGDDIKWETDDYDDYSGRDLIDDLYHTAVNGKGEIANANNPDQLKRAFTDILNKVLTGDYANSGVDASDVGIDDSDAKARYLYRGKLELGTNSGDVTATLLKEDGTEGTTPVWSAAAKLAERNFTTNPRKIATYANGKGVHFTWNKLTNAQKADLKTAPSGKSTNTDDDGKDRLAYISGDTTHDGGKFRQRPSISIASKSFTNLMGAVASSTPIFNGKPMLNIPNRAPFGSATARYNAFKKAQENRKGVVYVGANDGMMHAFDAKTGEEVFSYIPNLLFSTDQNKGLHYLTDPGMQLKSYVDLPFTIYDVYTDGAWRSVLVGGLRTGGPGIFVLDITDPVTVTSNLNTAAKIDAAAKNLVIGEYVDSGMGIMLQKPYVAMMNNGQWAAVFSNGYAEPGQSELEGQLYIVYLEKGSRTNFTVKKISTGSRNGLSPATLADVDGNGTVDKVYAGDLAGNMWAFDLSSNNDANWSKYQVFQSSISQPITSAPSITVNPYASASNTGTKPLLVAFGTGKYLTESDADNTDTQSFYVVADGGSGMTRSRSNLQRQRFGSNGAQTRNISGNSPDWVSTHGWYVDLPAGERVFVQPDIYKETVSFFSSKPSRDACVAGGESWFTSLQLNGRKLNPNPYTNLPDFDGGDTASVRVGDIIIVGTQPLVIGDNRITIGRGNELEDFEAIQPIENNGPSRRTGWEELIVE